jgi:hypothetical protein
VNTVRAVYQRLEQRGLLESQQGSGTFVAPTQPRPSAVGVIAADAAREAQAIGVDPREVAAALYVAMPRHARGAANPLGGKHPAAGEQSTVSQESEQDLAGGQSEQDFDATRAAHRRALRAQIGALERAIGEIEAEHPGVAPRPTATRRGPGPTLLNAEELEQVRSGLVHRLAAVQAAIDEQAAMRASGGEAMHQKDAIARARADVRTRARGRPEKDNASAPAQASDPGATPASPPSAHRPGHAPLPGRPRPEPEPPT